MFARLKQFISRDPAQSLPVGASIPAGQRVYAIGDIHGRLDLFAALVEAIEADDAAAGLAETTVILLGDLVDRGPESAGVIGLAHAWQGAREVRILAGNHEEMFLESFASTDVLRHFLRHGGRETLLSFGIEFDVMRAASLEELQVLMAEAVPEETRAFIAGFDDWIEIGDYLFVHAGINPSLPFDAQDLGSLRWIREPFLSHSAPLARIVVHGHTITEDIEERGHRIGIDTGAYSSGRLTALVLEGCERRYLETSQSDDGAVHAGARELAG